ncbi:MAG TPA: hypothetical protein VHT73_19460 [Thermodesulfobacteriota bacterium]|nr:hypothetical protein [Thermodesulfobacteriota bacterium]
MGHITRLFEVENDLTAFTVVGEVDVEQMLSQIISFLTGEPTQLVLWDITVGSLERISSNDVQMIVERAKPFSDRRKGGRTAIVCLRDLEYGISRMFQNFADIMQVPFEINVFRNLEKAREWLNEARKR